MLRTRHTLLATTLLLAACASDSYGPSIGSVPKGMPSLDNDRAVELDAEMKQARVEALSRRMDTLRESGQVSTPEIKEVEVVNEQVVSTDPVRREVAAAVDAPAIERTIINSDPDAILNRSPDAMSARLDAATRERAAKTAQTPAPAPVAPAPAPVVAAPVVVAPVEEAPEVVESAPAQELMTQPAIAVAAASQVAEKTNVDVKLPPLGQFRVYLGEFNFRVGQKNLSENDLDRLSEVLQPLLSRNVEGTFLVEGYASVDKNRTLKGDLNNLSLSLERANALEESLKFLGVDADRIRVQALGQTNPHKLAGNRPRAVLWLIQ